MADKAPNFGSAEEEAKYWKDMALQFQKGMIEAREELEEFQENSRDLEHELEAQLEQSDVRYRELQVISTRIQNENETYKVRNDQLQQQFHHQLTSLESELEDHRRRAEEFHKYIRELEQSNDEFEKSTRIMHATIEDLESKLNIAIERNAFIESELDEKEGLKTMVQRLKDESRDLRQEMKVRERREMPDVENKKNLELSKSHDKLIKFELDSPGTPLKVNTQHNTGAASPALTPSARISALNIVGDLLRNVSALENKVAHARSLPRRSADANTTESPRFVRTRRV
ncbi:nuclear distribution protein nudE-like 1 isoform X2 [Neocloeon triangulifer]|uniref:nuclear distribution protein nudE-like 1 isoform X2 n=1 Tax=Neocloeon triangulifer TaxID=2078957 RepID=UPI00286F6951|nr:nuclear distribution protein nudE-like 1 isoform X2 [Neocloeon triangulifer]